MADTLSGPPPTDQQEARAIASPVDAAVPRSLWWYSWRRLRKNRLAIVGLVIVSILVFAAVFAELVAPMNPNDQILEYGRKPSGFRGNVLLIKPPAAAFEIKRVPIQSYRVDGDTVRYVDFVGRPKAIAKSGLMGASESEWHEEPLFILGTDNYGRDMLSRLIYGARISLFIGLFAELLTLLIGVVLGALAGYYRGWVDAGVMYVTNVVWSFPFILLVIGFSLALGQGTWQSFVAIGIANWVDIARIVRGQFFSLRETEYVEATRALGFGSMRTIFRHILPNASGPITVLATAGFAYAIIAESSLSFLGLGVQSPTASWGQMIRDGYAYIYTGKNWGLSLYPSITIALAVFGFNLLGDGLRDALDPKLKV